MGPGDIAELCSVLATQRVLPFYLLDLLYLEDGPLEDVKGLHAVDDPHEVDVLGEVYVLLYCDLRRRVDQVIPGLRVRVGVGVRGQGLGVRVRKGE